MSLARTLWKENEDLARAALDQGFVRGIADGSLPIESFQYYVAQDAFFLESFARAYALALAHSPDRETLDESSPGSYPASSKSCGCTKATRPAGTYPWIV